MTFLKWIDFSKIKSFNLKLCILVVNNSLENAYETKLCEIDISKKKISVV